jgi:hypothetical protein
VLGREVHVAAGQADLWVGDQRFKKPLPVVPSARKYAKMPAVKKTTWIASGQLRLCPR